MPSKQIITAFILGVRRGVGDKAQATDRKCAERSDDRRAGAVKKGEVLVPLRLFR